MKSDIKSLSKEELKNLIKGKNHPSYRADQIYEWIWKKGVRSFEAMTNIPKTLISEIEEEFEFLSFEIVQTIKSKDETIKIAFRLHDNKLIEGVLIFAENRRTACISTQTGCPLKCSFCASGNISEHRNLSFGEIHDQIVSLNETSLKEKNSGLTNIVYMGIGEPFLNYSNLIRSIRIITSPDTFNWSPSRITVSTAGLTDKIKQYADDNLKTKLAISLHTADNMIRTSLMPVNISNDLNEIQNAIRYYNQTTGNTVMLEYLLLKNINDRISDAKKLITFCRGLIVKINLISFNPTSHSGYQPSDKEQLNLFFQYLEEKNMVVTIRHSKGDDINAACGQLSGSLNADNKPN
jgi:23S rRNA (adenine2503-C2)-methyltransferase